MGVVYLAIARFRSDQKEAISKNFVNLAKSLASSGHQVTAISPTGFDSDVEVSQHTFRKHSRYESLLEGLINLICLCFILNRLLPSSLTAKVNIHIATPMELLIVFLFLKPCYRRQTTLSVWQCYLSYKEYRNNRRFFLRNFAQYFHLLAFNSFICSGIYRYLLGFFKQVIVHSAYQKTQISALTKLPVNFVQNGVFPDAFAKPKSFDSGLLSLLYIGHAKPSKGVDVLIEIIAKLRQRQQVNFHLTLCLSGFGSQRRVEQLIEENELEAYVTFKENIDVATEMAIADLLILPLRTCVGTSLTPNIIVEAISCGLPIAISEFAQLDEVIQFDKNAIRIDLQDLTFSAKSIEGVHDKEALKQLSSYQLRQFKQAFTLDQFVAGYSAQLGLEWSEYG